jgi:hypothetical protein
MAWYNNYPYFLSDRLGFLSYWHFCQLSDYPVVHSFRCGTSLSVVSEEKRMLVFARGFFASTGVIALIAVSAFAADSIKGQVFGGGAPIANSTVVLWEASANAPKNLAETKT